MNRIKLIHDAAAKLFIKQGYSGTQISHIADAVGVAVGTIYHDFSGKQEIKNLILRASVEDGFLGSQLEVPIKGDLFLNLEDQILKSFKTSSHEFARHIANKADNYSFEDLVSDSFDMLSRHAAGCLFIEKNQSDSGKLYDYYTDYRRKFFQTMKEYLLLFIERGEVRPLQDVELTTVMIIEILSWWAMDVRYSSFETIDVSHDAARALCVDNIVTAYRA
ncbi:MAG: helix-turn-helix domain containing protein [Spirochaetales bacterium]|nr:helix-turn-helix domain containing protein [Spirochaetales bacterium]